MTSFKGTDRPNPVPTCVTCRHMQLAPPSMDIPPCCHRQQEILEFNPVSGWRPAQVVNYCRTERAPSASDGLCGPSGGYWEAKEKTVEKPETEMAVSDKVANAGLMAYHSENWQGDNLIPMKAAYRAMKKMEAKENG